MRRWPQMRSRRKADARSIPDYLSLLRAKARLLIAGGEREAAAEHLEALYTMAWGLGWQITLIRVRALQCLAAPTPDRALELLTEALALAEPDGYLRTFLDLGDPMAALLKQALARDISPGHVRRLLRAFAVTSDPQEISITVSHPRVWWKS